MSRPSLSFSLLLFCALSLVAMQSASAVSIIVPDTLASTEGNTSNGFPFNVGAFGIASERYQQVYAASEFPSSPIRITGITFRPDSSAGAAFSTTLANVQINLSTTAKAIDALSTTFANNVGADDAIVRSGALPLSSSFLGPVNGPKEFDISISFSQPFDYNPANGNLLVDVRNFLGGTTTQFDSHSALDAISRVATSSSGSVSSPSAELTDTEGLVTQFTYTFVPEPSTLVLSLFALAGLAALAIRKRRVRCA